MYRYCTDTLKLICRSTSTTVVFTYIINYLKFISVNGRSIDINSHPEGWSYMY